MSRFQLTQEYQKFQPSLVIVHYYAKRCEPCKIIQPWFEDQARAAKWFNEDVIFAKLDAVELVGAVLELNF